MKQRDIMYTMHLVKGSCLFQLNCLYGFWYILHILMRTLINSKNFMVLKTFIAVHCKYIRYRLKKKREGRYKMDGMRGVEGRVQLGWEWEERREGSRWMGWGGEKERYSRDGSEREEGKVREGWEWERRREGTRGMGVREKKGRYERDVIEGERKVHEGWEWKGRRDGTREMGVRGKKGRFKRDGSEREEGKIQEGWE